MIETFAVELPHGITLSCRAAGERGRPVLMFLHGFPEAAFVWDALLEHFSQAEHGGWRCIAPNLRGYERSSAPKEAEAYRGKPLVQDIAALIALEGGGKLDALIAHDWGGALAWGLAAQHPELLSRLIVINSPHPGTFQRELANNPQQQAASAYMNFLIRPDAEKLLADNDFKRLREFFMLMGAANGPHAWWNPKVEGQYREVWQAGLTGALNFYRATPLRPPRPDDPGAAAVQMPREALTVKVPTLVLWAMNDIALPPALVDGLEDYVPDLQLQRIEGATHWVVHEMPQLVIDHLARFLRPDA